MGGIFTKIGLATATGSANTDATLFSEGVAGGSVSDGNALRLRLDFEATGDCGAKIALGGVLLHDTGGIPSSLGIDMEIWRDGNDAAIHIRGVANGTPYDVWAYPVTGLAWGSSQTLTVIGKSDTAGGLVLQRAGLQK